MSYLDIDDKKGLWLERRIDDLKQLKLTQTGLDHELLTAYFNSSITDFKAALACGANPDACYQDNQFKGFSMLNFVYRNPEFLASLLEAGASISGLKHFSPITSAALNDFDRNVKTIRDHAYLGEHSTDHVKDKDARACIDLLFVAGFDLTEKDLHILKTHRKDAKMAGVISYAECVQRADGTYPTNGTRTLERHPHPLDEDQSTTVTKPGNYPIERPTAEYLLHAYGIQFDLRERARNIALWKQKNAAAPETAALSHGSSDGTVQPSPGVSKGASTQ